MSRMLVERQEVSEEVVDHLQNCVQCRACEAVCPSQMDYVELFDQAQEELAEGQKRGFYISLALALVTNRRWLNAALPLVWFYQISGIRWLLS